jgi:hypothetical protein
MARVTSAAASRCMTVRTVANWTSRWRPPPGRTHPPSGPGRSLFSRRAPACITGTQAADRSISMQCSGSGRRHGDLCSEAVRLWPGRIARPGHSHRRDGLAEALCPQRRSGGEHRAFRRRRGRRLRGVRTPPGGLMGCRNWRSADSPDAGTGQILLLGQSPS